MNSNLIAKASTTIHAPAARVWAALVDPDAVRQFMFGTTIVTDWQVGHPVVWKGEWQGKTYEDKGILLRFEPGRTMQYSHFSPLSGVPDVPENYHTVTVELSPEGDQTRVTLAQDHNATEEERTHSEQNWAVMLDGLKKFVEGAS